MSNCWVSSILSIKVIYVFWSCCQIHKERIMIPRWVIVRFLYLAEMPKKDSFLFYGLLDILTSFHLWLPHSAHSAQSAHLTSLSTLIYSPPSTYDNLTQLTHLTLPHSAPWHIDLPPLMTRHPHSNPPLSNPPQSNHNKQLRLSSTHPSQPKHPWEQAFIFFKYSEAHYFLRPSFRHFPAFFVLCYATLLCCPSVPLLCAKLFKR